MFRGPLLQEENHRDSEFTTLWTTREWAAWPRGLSKAAARVMCDPLVFFTVLPPVWILACNVSWPHRVSHQSLRTRIMYVMARVIFIPSLYAGVVYLLGAATYANMVVSLLTVHACVKCWLPHKLRHADLYYSLGLSGELRFSDGFINTSLVPDT